MKAIVSTEKLIHFQCGLCKKWWTMADALLPAWYYCPWCSKYQICKEEEMINLGLLNLNSACVRCGKESYHKDGTASKLCVNCGFENVVDLIGAAKGLTDKVRVDRLAYVMGIEETEE